MIIINEPQIIKKHKRVRLSANIDINNSIKTLWVEVDDKYAKYLVKDRCDAFLIALLPIAMRYKKDIEAADEIIDELKECADNIAATDEKMMIIREKIRSVSSD